MPEPQIAPSRARVALAARAGLRPWSPWLVPAALCLIGAAALPGSLDPSTGATLQAAWSGDAAGLWGLAARTWSMVLAVAVAVAVAAVAASGGLGWRARDVRLGRVGPVRRRGAGVLLAGALLGLAGLTLRGAPAGAARAVEASADGLSLLWLAWLRRGLLAVGLVSLVAAAIDLWLGKRAIWRALHQTRAEVQAQ